MAIVDNVIRIAKGEVGYHEGRSNGSWNNHTKYAPAVPSLEWAQNQAWCATFVSWVALKAGVGELYPRTASCDVAREWFRSRGQYSEYPAIGAQVFYGTPADSNHTGIVIGFDAATITTVEGNTNDSGSREGDGVYVKVRGRTDSNVLGYGYPAFSEGIVSADPARAPKPVKARVTRGKAVDKAIRWAERVKGSKARRKAAQKAIEAFEAIPTWKVR